MLADEFVHKHSNFFIIKFHIKIIIIQSMLGSVITARDRWLKPGGLILPSHATV